MVTRYEMAADYDEHTFGPNGWRVYKVHEDGMYEALNFIHDGEVISVDVDLEG